VRAHVAQVAARREGRPFLRGRVLQSVVAVVGVIETAHGLAILLDELTGVELGVDHHCIGRGVTEQRLNHVHGRVVVQMFGCKDAPAIVRQQHETRPVRAAGARVNRDSADPAALTSSFYLFYLAKEMKQGELLGSLEHIILLALVRLDGNAHGMIVRREIEERTGRNISIGAVYATLERLEAKGYVSSFTGEPTPERGGRAKRLFRVEAAGKRALQISDQTIRRLTAGLKGSWRTI